MAGFMDPLMAPAWTKLRRHRLRSSEIALQEACSMVSTECVKKGRVYVLCICTIQSMHSASLLTKNYAPTLRRLLFNAVYHSGKWFEFS